MLNVKRILLLMIFFLFPSWLIVHAQEMEYQDQDIYPQKISKMLQFKAGYFNDRLEEDSIWFLSVKGELRLKPFVHSKFGGGYIQSQFPVTLYYFDPGNLNAFALDVRYRPEIGPNINTWIPLFFPEVSYLFNSKDWYIGRNGQMTHTLLIGGVVRFYLKGLNNAVVEISGSRSVLGDGFTRFSCYTHWFFTDHFGATIHGDNFTRLFNGTKKQYGSIVFGVVIK